MDRREPSRRERQQRRGGGGAGGDSQEIYGGGGSDGRRSSSIVGSDESHHRSPTVSGRTHDLREGDLLSSTDRNGCPQTMHESLLLDLPLDDHEPNGAIV